jgi:hypothetical protein
MRGETVKKKNPVLASLNHLLLHLSTRKALTSHKLTAALSQMVK